MKREETELLLKINQGLSLKIQKPFNELVTKRQAETLTSDEHQELLYLIEQIENSDTERVKYLAELAHLRGVSLTALIQELDQKPVL